MPAKGRQPVSAQRIDELVDELKNRAALLAKIARRMEKNGQEQIEVMNLPMAERGVISFRNFYLSCVKEVGGE